MTAEIWGVVTNFTNNFYTRYNILNWPKTAPGAQTPGTTLPTMTAHQTNRSQSDNSASLPNEAESISVERDPRTTRIVQYITQQGPADAREIASKAGWTQQETEAHLRRLEAENYVQLFGEPRDRIIIVTERGERLARDHA